MISLHRRASRRMPLSASLLIEHSVSDSIVFVDHRKSFSSFFFLSNNLSLLRLLQCNIPRLLTWGRLFLPPSAHPHKPPSALPSSLCYERFFVRWRDVKFFWQNYAHIERRIQASSREREREEIERKKNFRCIFLCPFADYSPEEFKQKKRSQNVSIC